MSKHIAQSDTLNIMSNKDICFETDSDQFIDATDTHRDVTRMKQKQFVDTGYTQHLPEH
jgi:hypothetical protein